MQLYERWCETCGEHRTGWAVRDLTVRGGREWRFEELRESLGSLPPLDEGSLQPVSTDAGVVPFLLRTLQSWRDRNHLGLHGRAPAGVF